MKRFYFSLCLSCIIFIFISIRPANVMGQRQSAGVPLSIAQALDPGSVHIYDLQPPDEDLIRQKENSKQLPYRFALSLKADFSATNSGNTLITVNGLRVWRLALRSAGAKALILYFDRFRIPEGGKLFVYNPSRTVLFGAYTSLNENSFGTFACPLIEGEKVVLEYNAPASLPLPDIHISELSYAFRGVANYNEPDAATGSGICEVNVNCSEGNNWQKQKRGVVKIVTKDSTGGSSWCSGSLVNNTNNDGTPYLLTANHCGAKSRPVDLSQWLFYFNYEMPGCPNATASTPAVLLGAVLQAHGGTEYTGSDFYLVKLKETIPDSLHVYFNGWSREDVPSPNGTGIHHPMGDVKKISTYLSPLVTSYYPQNPNPCFWEVWWNKTANGHGVTEGGSSGSPIFSSEGLIVGTLTGGNSLCDSAHINLSDYYGKFSWHWDKNGADSSKVLKYWLDPMNTGLMRLGGWALGVEESISVSDLKLFPNPASQSTNLVVSGGISTGDAFSITCTDILGTIRHVPVSELSAGHYLIDTRNLDPGIFFVTVTGSAFRKSIKLVKI
ncbi:MAG: T9SS type A sorting domain-containing protein [Bacteroidota bacterium]